MKNMQKQYKVNFIMNNPWHFLECLYFIPYVYTNTSKNILCEKSYWFRDHFYSMHCMSLGKADSGQQFQVEDVKKSILWVKKYFFQINDRKNIKKKFEILEIWTCVLKIIILY